MVGNVESLLVSALVCCSRDKQSWRPARTQRAATTFVASCQINTYASRWGWAAPGLRVERGCWLKAVCATLEHLKLGSDLTHRAPDLADEDPQFVEIDCEDRTKLRASTSAEVHQMVDAMLATQRLVAAGDVPKNRLEQLQRVCGFSRSPRGLLADTFLRQQINVIEVLRYDWMHSCLQDGTVTTEAGLLLGAFDSIDISPKDVEAYLKTGWCFPASTRPKNKMLWQVFSECRHCGPERLKCSASEMLGVFPLLRHYVQTQMSNQPAIALQKDAYLAVCTTVDIILRAKKGLLSTREAAPLLRDAVQQHLHLHKRAYGSDHIKPTFHWLFDVADQLARDDIVIDCFLVERLHLRAKQMASIVLNTRAFERSVLSSMLLCQRNFLLEADLTLHGLIGKTAVFPGVPAARLSDHLVLNGLRISVQDLVFCESSVGFVTACCSEG